MVSTSEIMTSLVTLTVLEIVLGMDNLVFISIATSRLPEHQQPIARRIGLLAALVSRLILLALIVWLTTFDVTLFVLFSHPITLKGIVFILGGGYLVYKSIVEMRHARDLALVITPKHRSKHFFNVVLQIMVFDIVFSFDSIITAIGIAKQYWVMAVAIIIAIIMMMLATNWVSHVINTYPKIKALAFCFLTMIGVFLLLNGFGLEISHDYIYTAIIFGIFVQMVNSYCRA